MEWIHYIMMPLLACLVIVGIHSYLGIHVIRRKVIFVDLALAQLAALGTTVGFLFGIMPETTAAFIFSILFVTAGAAIFSLTRMRSKRVPHEAIIGLVYAIAAALAILVIDRAPSGAEHLKNVLVGRIEWVTWHEVAIAAALYAVVGAVHWILRRPFYLISEQPEEAFKRGMRVRAWDFLFYLTFGIVISISVKIAGVLLVFIFLVVPAVSAVLITQNHLNQLLIGWAMGVVVTVVGMVVSYHASLPSGPTVVAVYGVVLVLVSVSVFVWRSERRTRSIGLALAGTVVVAAFVGLVVVLGLGMRGTRLGSSSHHHEHEIVDPSGEPHSHDGHGTAESVAARDERDDAHLGDPEEVIDQSRSRIEEGRDVRGALRNLAALLADEDAGFMYKEQAIDLIEKRAGQDFGYDPEAGPQDNGAALEAIGTWIDQPTPLP